MDSASTGGHAVDLKPPSVRGPAFPGRAPSRRLRIRACLVSGARRFPGARHSSLPPEPGRGEGFPVPPPLNPPLVRREAKWAVAKPCRFRMADPTLSARLRRIARAAWHHGTNLRFRAEGLPGHENSFTPPDPGKEPLRNRRALFMLLPRPVDDDGGGNRRTRARPLAVEVPSSSARVPGHQPNANRCPRPTRFTGFAATASDPSRRACCSRTPRAPSLSSPRPER